MGSSCTNPAYMGGRNNHTIAAALTCSEDLRPLHEKKRLDAKVELMQINMQMSLCHFID